MTQRTVLSDTDLVSATALEYHMAAYNIIICKHNIQKITLSYHSQDMHALFELGMPLISASASMTYIP